MRLPLLAAATVLAAVLIAACGDDAVPTTEDGLEKVGDYSGFSYDFSDATDAQIEAYLDDIAETFGGELPESEAEEKRLANAATSCRQSPGALEENLGFVNDTGLARSRAAYTHLCPERLQEWEEAAAAAGRL